jgi:hypothetical protein
MIDGNESWNRRSCLKGIAKRQRQLLEPYMRALERLELLWWSILHLQ